MVCFSRNADSEMLMNGKWTSLCTLTIHMSGIFSFFFCHPVDFIFKVYIFKKFIQEYHPRVSNSLDAIAGTGVQNCLQSV